MQKLVDFFQIAEKLECEYRITRMSDGKKQTVASHSWNMAMMAMVLKPYLKNAVDMERVFKMCLLHDLPEAIAHDVPLHEQTDAVRAKKHADERVAVKHIVELLGDDDIRACFDEYDARKSAESRLVKALDVLDTAVQHMCTQNLKYIGDYADNFYWKMFFSADFAKQFDFEPVLRHTFDEIKQRIVDRLDVELNVDAGDFVK